MLLLVVIGVGYLAGKQKTLNESADTASVIGTTIGFGQQMHKVSLLAPKADYEVAIDQAYSRYASPEAIAGWKAAPQTAPGRETSSPWPQGIEILAYNEQADGSFVVTGNVNETDSTGGVVSKYPVTVTLQKIKGTWMVTKFERTAPVTSTSTSTNATSTQ